LLSSNRESASSNELKAVKEYALPESAKDVKAFLGLASPYCRFVTHIFGV